MNHSASPSLSAKEIARLLPDNLKNTPIYIYDEIDSTNNQCKRISDDAPLFIVAAESQTAGRGRRGKSFYSPFGSGLYLSISLSADKYGNMQMITLNVAVAVSFAIEELTGLSPKIKWVNDIYLEGRKICGILCEATDGRIIIGIGINCTTDSFPKDIAAVAGSLAGHPVSRNALAASIIKNLTDCNFSVADEYRHRSLLTGKEITYTLNGNEFSALVTGIDDNGNLSVVNNDGTFVSLNSGEVQLKKPIFGD